MNQNEKDLLKIDERARRKAISLSVFISGSLLILKFWAYWASGSQAILSDAMESIVNVVASIFAFFIVLAASKPADQDHPYGHGKLEYFSAAFEGGLITFAAVAIILESMSALYRGSELKNLNEGLLLVIIAGVINLIFGLYLKRVGKNHHSEALIASGTHLLSDFWTSMGITVGLGLVLLTNIVWLDPIIAIAVALHLVFEGMKVIKKSIQGLMDAEDPQLLERLRKVFLDAWQPGIIHIHHLRVIRSGRFHHIDAHVVIPEFWDIALAHSRTDHFEKRVLKSYVNEGEIAFHLDPCRRVYCENCDLSDCPIRVKPFVEKRTLSLLEMTAPEEPDHPYESSTNPV